MLLFTAAFGFAEDKEPTNDPNVQTSVATFFQEYKYLSEFGQTVSQSAASHWGPECSCDKGAIISYEDAKDVAAYPGRVRERIAKLVQESGGTFRVISQSGGDSATTRFIARYTIGQRTGFLRINHAKDEPLIGKTTAIFSILLWEIPFSAPTKSSPLSPAEQEAGPAQPATKPADKDPAEVQTPTSTSKDGPR